MPRKCTVSQLRWHARRIPCWGRWRVSSANGLKSRISDLWRWAMMLSAQARVCMRTLKNRKQSWELSARTLLVSQDWYHKFKQCSVVWVWVHCNNKSFCSLRLWLPHSLCNGSQKASWLRFKQSQCGQRNVSPRYEAEAISTAQQVHITVEHKKHIYDTQILNHRKMIPFHTS